MNESKDDDLRDGCFLPCSGVCDKTCKNWIELNQAIEVVKDNILLVDNVTLLQALGFDERLVRYANTLETKDMNECMCEITRTTAVGIEYIDTLMGDDFEMLIKRLYQKMGFTVNLTKQSHDGGIDASAQRDNRSYKIQCKRYKANIGVRYIREFVGVLNADKSESEGIFITTSDFTNPAKRFALENNIQMINRAKLIELTDQFIADDVPGFKVEKGITCCSIDRVLIEIFLTNTSSEKMTNVKVALCFYDNNGNDNPKKTINPRTVHEFPMSLETGETVKFKFETTPLNNSYTRFVFEFDRNGDSDTFRCTSSSKINIFD